MPNYLSLLQSHLNWEDEQNEPNYGSSVVKLLQCRIQVSQYEPFLADDFHHTLTGTVPWFPLFDEVHDTFDDAHSEFLPDPVSITNTKG
jgi:hypothetical protein